MWAHLLLMISKYCSLRCSCSLAVTSLILASSNLSGSISSSSYIAPSLISSLARTLISSLARTLISSLARTLISSLALTLISSIARTLVSSLAPYNYSSSSSVS